VDAFISDCALPKKRRKQKQQICFEWRIFSKTTTNSEKKMFSKQLRKKREMKKTTSVSFIHYVRLTTTTKYPPFLPLFFFR